MSSFFEALAHPEDSLPDHQLAVGQAAWASLEGVPERVRRAALLMGLLHDAGKATPWFQRYLHGDERRSERTNHALLGAVLAHRILSYARDQGQVSAWTHWTVVAGIFRHHGDFNHDLEQTMVLLAERAADSRPLRDQLGELDEEGLRSWLIETLDDLGIPLDVPSLGPDAVLDAVDAFFPRMDGLPFEGVEDGFDLLAAFGAFVGADKMDTAHRGFEREARDLPPEIVDRYKESEFGEPTEDLDEQREEIFAEVQERLTSEEESWIYTLTAPTGSGKTLTGLAAGLRLKETKEAEGGESRLVYCLPFTSVIDQNSRRYEGVLEENEIPVEDPVLLKHHHLADPRYHEADEPIEDGGELLVETWESELIVTTFHQLVHTLFTSKNKNLKRFAALRNAVVVLDEVQAIDHKYWEDFHKAMRLCAERLGTTFVLMTATMPLIVDPEETPELLPSYPQRYEKLARTELVLRIEEPMEVEELAAEIRSSVENDEDQRRIVIVNRRKTARRLYQHLEDLSVPTAMLSTDLTPLDRERVIEELGLEDSESEDPFVLVSTQVIEAGVDVSSDVLVREIAPLDSIIQSAGRCNREFELRPERGRVEIVELQEDGKGLAVPPYSSFLVSATLETLEEFGDRASIDEARFHEMAHRYYKILQQRSASASVTDLLAEGGVHNLDDHDEGLRLVDDRRPRQAHFIIQNEADREIWQEYVDIQNMEINGHDDFREKKHLFQDIKREFSKRLVNYPSKERPTDEVIPVEPEEAAYDRKTGLQRNLAEASYAFI